MKGKGKTKTRPFDSAEFLDSPELLPRIWLMRSIQEAPQNRKHLDGV